MNTGNNNIKSYKDLLVWQKSMNLCELIYKTLTSFPIDEKYGLVSQMKRSSISIPSNIAEGKSRGGRKEYLQFLYIAYGSASELETQLELSYRLGFLNKVEYTNIDNLLKETLKMLNKLTSNLKLS